MGEFTNEILLSWEKKLFDDVVLMKVLESLTKSPKSVKIISQETEIPESTVYVKMRVLRKTNLVSRSGEIAKTGGKKFHYHIS